jgi:hypothetical protein
MKKRISILLMACVISLLMMSSLNAESAPNEVVRAARDGLRMFLNAIPEGELGYFGFTSKEEFDQTTIGTPFRIYTISPNKILSYKGEADISSLLSPTGEWLCPVICLGKARVLLTVARMQGQWQTVDLGGAIDAVEIEQISQSWPPSQGYEMKFIRVYQANSDFILLTKGKVSNLVPLKGAAVVLGLVKKGETYEYKQMSPADVLPKLAPVVKAALQERY